MSTMLKNRKIILKSKLNKKLIKMVTSKSVCMGIDRDWRKEESEILCHFQFRLSKSTSYLKYRIKLKLRYFYHLKILHAYINIMFLRKALKE